MQQLENNPLHLSRAGILMLTWGLLLVIAGALNQWYTFPSFEAVLYMWGTVTVIGLIVQGICQIKDKPLNYATWVGVMAAGWAFTFYSVYGNVSLFADLAGVWFFLMAVGHFATAFHVDSRFFWLAGFNLLVAVVFELVGHHILTFDPIVTYTSIVLGGVAGVAMLVGAAMGRIKQEDREPSSTESSTTASTAGVVEQ
jgi:hypothetical protein